MLSACCSVLCLAASLTAADRPDPDGCQADIDMHWKSRQGNSCTCVHKALYSTCEASLLDFISFIIIADEARPAPGS